MYIPSFKSMYQKHVEKSLEKFEKSETRKNYHQNSEQKKMKQQKHRTYVGMYIVGHLRTKFEGFILIYEAMIAKKMFNLLLAEKYAKLTRSQWNSNSTNRDTYWMYMPSFKLISQSMMQKVPKKLGRMDGYHHGIIRPFPKRAYKRATKMHTIRNKQATSDRFY